MPMTGAYATQKWRIRARFTTPASYTTTSNYAVTRKDGGPTSVAVQSVVVLPSTSPALVGDLVLTEPLISDVTYILTFNGADTAELSWREPEVSASHDRLVDDPEAEVFGVDVDWIFGDPTPDGDAPEIRGQQCLVEDCACVAFLFPGELVQYPEDGAGLPDRVNGPISSASGSELNAKVVAQWRRDDRVIDASSELSIGTDGSVDLYGRVKSVAIAKDLTVRNT